jgi:hypothetical protein
MRTPEVVLNSVSTLSPLPATPDAATAAAAAAGTRPFRHFQSAHCESGVITSLLRHEGLPVTEPLMFGLASGLSFCYFPPVRVNRLPLISYRMTPRYILNSLRRILDLPLRFETFATPQEGQRRLDELLAQDRPVGMQGSVYFLPYFPRNLRFHFNAHNFIAWGRDAATGDYFISDPSFSTPSRCPAADLQRARFVRGTLAPRGLIYHLERPLRDTSIERIIPLLRGAILKNVRMMLWLPLCAGTAGIRLFGQRLRFLPVKRDPDFCRRYIGHIVRMQEEIGTGGAGFRFMYAAFLQEAAGLTGISALDELAMELTNIGDEWRRFALTAARQAKGRDPLDTGVLADCLRALSRREHGFFKTLGKAVS